MVYVIMRCGVAIPVRMRQPYYPVKRAVKRCSTARRRGSSRLRVNCYHRQLVYPNSAVPVLIDVTAQEVPSDAQYTTYFIALKSAPFESAGDGNLVGGGV